MEGMAMKFKTKTFKVGIPIGERHEWSVLLKFDGNGKIIKVLDKDGNALPKPRSHDDNRDIICPPGRYQHTIISGIHYCLPY